MQYNAKAILDAQKIEMEQSELILKTAGNQQSKEFKEQKAQLDRLSKEQMKAIDAMLKLVENETKKEIEADKIASNEQMKSAELLTNLTMKGD